MNLYRENRIGRSLFFFVDKLVTGLLEQVDGFHEMFFHQEDEDIRKRCDATKGDTCICQRLSDRRNDTDFLRYVTVAQHLETAPTDFLLDIIRSHELGADNGQLVFRARCETHVAFREDHGDFTKLWQLVDAEFVLQHHDFELLIHRQSFTRVNGASSTSHSTSQEWSRTQFSISPVHAQGNPVGVRFFVICATK